MAKKIDKQALRMKIQELDIDNELKSQLLDAVSEKKTFGLVWEDHPEDAEERLKSMLPVLREDKEAAIISDADDAPNHVLIEGDNLEALMALSYTHEGKVDVIYIDPPYNTGNKDFVYNDSFVDSEDGYRHSKWLSFMEKRLRLAKNLLSDKGVIFISIDDNEQASLKLLCDEVFGGDKFICNYIWQKKTGAADANGVAVITEYILAYCMCPSSASEIFAYNKEAFDINRYKYTDVHEPIRGPHYYDSLDRGSIRYSDTQNYPIIAPDGTNLYPNDRTSFVNDGWTWKWSKEKVEWGLKNDFIVIVPNSKKKSGWSVKYKIYLNVDNEGNEIKKNVPYKNLITDVLNSDATSEIKEIFGSKAFNYAKPTFLIAKLIGNIENKNSLILDFFAGSGTTLHATMQLNAEDGGHRQCILVTNNENNICRDVTYERNKHVIQGYTTPKGVAVEGLNANNLRYYHADFVSRQSSHQNKKEQAYAMLDLLCIKENVYDEKKMFGCLSLEGKEKLVRYFAYNETKMLLIYDTRVVPYIVREIAGMAEENLNIKTYIFADGSYPYTADFEEVLSKVTLVAMPFSMNKALRNVLPEENDIELNDEPDTEEE